MTRELEKELQQQGVKGGSTGTLNMRWVTSSGRIKNLNIGVGDSKTDLVTIDLPDGQEFKDVTVKVETLTKERHGLGKNKNNPYQGLSASEVARLRALKCFFKWNGIVWYLVRSDLEDRYLERNGEKWVPRKRESACIV